MRHGNFQNLNAWKEALIIKIWKDITKRRNVKEVHKPEKASVSNDPSSKKYQEIVEIKKYRRHRRHWSARKMKDTKAPAEREKAAAAEAYHTWGSRSTRDWKKKHEEL